VDIVSDFEQLVGSLSRIAGHSDDPGKEKAVGWRMAGSKRSSSWIRGDAGGPGPHPLVRWNEREWHAGSRGL